MDRRSFIRGAIIAASTPAVIGAATIANDPIIKVIREYRAGLEAYRDHPGDWETLEEEDLFVEETYGPQLERLLAWESPALTREGALEAMRLMKEDRVFTDRMGSALWVAVVGFLENQQV